MLVRRFRTYFKRAVVTFIVGVVYSHPRQYRLLLFLKAVWAKPVRWLIRLAFWFKRVDEHSNNNFVKAVSRCCALPLFVIFDLMFQLLIDFGNALILSLNGKHARLKVDDVINQCCDVFAPLRIRWTCLQCFRQIFYRGHTGHSGSKFSDHVVEPVLATNDTVNPVVAQNSQPQAATHDNSG